jgi:subtilisin family serine protease
MHTAFSTRFTAVSLAAAALLCVVIFFGAPRVASGSDDSQTLAAVPGEIIVRYDDSTSPRMRSAIAEELDADLVSKLRMPRTELIRVPKGSVDEAIDALEQEPGVLSAEPNRLIQPDTTPNDSYFGALWGMDNTGQPVEGVPGTADADIDAPEAWNMLTGNEQVVVAVLDTGVDSSHSDLSDRIAPGGFDFADDDTNPSDQDGHGTHVAGTIGAHGDNAAGVAGVNWNVRIQPLRFIGEFGGTLADELDALNYVAQQHVRIMNGSYGYFGPPSPAEKAAFAAAKDTLFVLAAGNDGVNNDVAPHYPCSYNLPNIVCVAATDNSDQLADFSNYGKKRVHLAAPGVNVLSTVPTWFNPYGYEMFSGTSMATPHVAGVAALALGLVPDLTTKELRRALLKGVDKKANLKGKVRSGGRLNAEKTLKQALAIKRAR